MPRPLPRRTQPVHASVASRLLRPSPFLRRVGVRNSISLSRPAQAYCALRPNGLLARLTRTLSRGFSSTRYRTTLLASFDVDRHLHRRGLSPRRVFAPVRRTEKCGLILWFSSLGAHSYRHWNNFNKIRLWVVDGGIRLRQRIAQFDPSLSKIFECAPNHRPCVG